MQHSDNIHQSMSMTPTNSSATIKRKLTYAKQMDDVMERATAAAAAARQRPLSGTQPYQHPSYGGMPYIQTVYGGMGYPPPSWGALYRHPANGVGSNYTPPIIFKNCHFYHDSSFKDNNQMAHQMPDQMCHQSANDRNQKKARTLYQEIDGPNNIILRDSDCCQYKYDSKSYIVEVNFLKKVENDGEDNELLMQLMELDNIVLIMNNLCSPEILTVDKLFNGQTRAHDKFKMFKRNGWNDSTIVEDEKHVVMNISDYSQYLDKYKEVAKATIEGREASVDPVSPNVSPFNDEFNNFTVLLLTRYIKQMIKVLIDGEYENIDVRNTLIVSLSVLFTSTTVEFTKLLQLCIILHSTVSIMISKSSDMNSSMNSSNLSSIMQCFLVNPHACCVSRRSQCTQKMALMHLSPLPGPILVYTLTVK
jgi:hypothetical protein